MGVSAAELPSLPDNCNTHTYTPIYTSTYLITLPPRSAVSSASRLPFLS
jgi:hypothetical protein